MQHLLSIDQLSQATIMDLIQQALYFKQSAQYPQYPFYSLATLFYENSTRTRVSFELAGKHLGMPVVNLDVQTSSETKGEIIDDTFQTLMAMGINYMVVRHPKEGTAARLASLAKPNVHVVNAGEGQLHHPSQALLDLMTLLEKKPDLKGLKIAIVGDVLHSRVAQSFQTIAKCMGVGDLVIVAPTHWQPKNLIAGRMTTSLKEGLSDADAVMCLRVQKERLDRHDAFDLATYRQHYALTASALAKAKPDALVMHPGPMNRGVEIDADVADGPQSVILEQVQNGVFMRMAILDALAK